MKSCWYQKRRKRIIMSRRMVFLFHHRCIILNVYLLQIGAINASQSFIFLLLLLHLGQHKNVLPW